MLVFVLQTESLVDRMACHTVFGVAVDALSLRLAPAYTPGAMARRRGNRHDTAHIFGSKVCKLEHQHATHGATNDCRALRHAQVVQQQPLQAAVVCQPRPDAAHLMLSQNLPHIVAYCREGELGSVPALARVAVAARDGARGAVRAAERVDADDEEARHIKRAPVCSQQRTPPIGHVGAAAKRVADDHGIVAARRQLALCAVGDGYIVQSDARLEREGGDDGNLLVGYESGERILWLARQSFCVGVLVIVETTNAGPR